MRHGERICYQTLIGDRSFSHASNRGLLWPQHTGFSVLVGGRSVKGSNRSLLVNRLFEYYMRPVFCLA